MSVRARKSIRRYSIFLVMTFILIALADRMLFQPPKYELSIQISKPDHYFREWIELKKTSSIHNEFKVRYKSEFDTTSFGDDIQTKTIDLPPWLGGDFSAHLYRKNPDTLAYKTDGNITLLDLKQGCIRSSIKDPDLQVIWCQPMPFIKENNIDLKKLEYIGTIQQNGSTFSLNKTE